MYQLQRPHDNATLDIHPTTPGGYSDAAAHEHFCASGACVFGKIYDQSPNKVSSRLGAPTGGLRVALASAAKGALISGPDPVLQNHLSIGPPGGAHRQEDIPADAMAGPLAVGGHRVYGVRMDPPSG